MATELADVCTARGPRDPTDRHRHPCDAQHRGRALLTLIAVLAVLVVRGSVLVYCRRFEAQSKEQKQNAETMRSLLASLGGFSLAGLALLGFPNGTANPTAMAANPIAMDLMSGFTAYLVGFLLIGASVTELGQQAAEAFAHAGHMSLACFVWRYAGLIDPCAISLYRLPGIVCIAVAGLTTLRITIAQHQWMFHRAPRSPSTPSQERADG
jgi:hypothetical protein